MATAKKPRKATTATKATKVRAYIAKHPFAKAKEVAKACGTTAAHVYATMSKIRLQSTQEGDKVCGDGYAYDHENGQWEAVNITMSEDPADSTDSTDSTDAMLAERGQRYGAFVRQAEIAVRLKAVLAEYHVEGDIDLAYDQMEALHMICNKLGRIINGDPDYSDSWHDIAGYAKLVANRLDGKVV